MLFVKVTASGNNFTKCFGSGGECLCPSPFILTHVKHVKTTENKPQKWGLEEALQGIDGQPLRNNFICTIFSSFLQLPATLKLTPVQ